MQDLNAQQIVLLTLLVSFVTSIATGITTVSLMEKAPEPITQTINRIVEKTVERVVDSGDDNKGSGEVKVEKVVETVVVNSDDMVVDAISRNTDSLVRIFSRAGDLKVFVGIGIIIKDDGYILVDSASITPRNKYIAQFTSGEKEVSIVFREPNNPFAVFKIAEENMEKFQVITLGDSQSIKLGQTVVSIAGEVSPLVSTGLISNFDKIDLRQKADNNKTSIVINSINTNIDSKNLINGAVLLNLKGELVGMRVGFDQNKPNSFMPSQNIKDFVSSDVFKS